MNSTALILIILLIVLLGGGYGLHSGYVGLPHLGGVFMLILVVLIVLALVGRL